MGLSRRQFTRDFKLTAVRQLEQGIPVGEVARALEVNPSVLHRWRREVRQGPGNAFPGGGTILRFSMRSSVRRVPTLGNVRDLRSSRGKQGVPSEPCGGLQ